MASSDVGSLSGYGYGPTLASSVVAGLSNRGRGHWGDSCECMSRNEQSVVTTLLANVPDAKCMASNERSVVTTLLANVGH
ncbi:MAG: hypothetical protein NTY42_24450 [Planctomycetota bacterium]|nr:hypothetical protein [Planctomycetota bacterium]